MPNRSVPPAVPGDDLGLQAFLYVSDELEGSEAASFERHLGEDQAAREALCRAVRLCLTLGSPTDAAPNPAYRERVRQRLRSWPTSGRVAGRARAPRGHPVIWGLLGAAAALLLMLVLQRPHAPAIPDDDSSSPVYDLARELVELDILVLDLKAEQLKKELSEVEDELLRTRDPSEKKARERYEGLLDKANRGKK
jgi:anti-sigma factor RsiW